MTVILTASHIERALRNIEGGATNRHYRRKQDAAWKQGIKRFNRDAQGVVDIDIIGGAALFDRPEFFSAALYWVKQIPKNQPQCILCDRQWTSLRDGELPRTFVFLKPWQRPAENWLVSGICSKCETVPNLRERCTAAFKELWPNCKDLGMPHPAPGRQQ